MSYVKCQMSKMKSQMSIRLNFCRSVPPELFRSFLLNSLSPLVLFIILFVVFSLFIFFICPSMLSILVKTISTHITYANSARFVEVALHKNDSSCKTNSDAGAEDVELGRSIQNSMLKSHAKSVVLISICYFETSF